MPARRRQCTTTCDRRSPTYFSEVSYGGGYDNDKGTVQFYLKLEDQRKEAKQQRKQSRRFISLCNVVFILMNVFRVYTYLTYMLQLHFSVFLSAHDYLYTFIRKNNVYTDEKSNAFIKHIIIAINNGIYDKILYTTPPINASRVEKNISCIEGDKQKNFSRWNLNPLPQDGPEVGDVTTTPSGGRIDTDSNATLTPCYDSESNTTESNGTSNSNQSSSRGTSVSCRPNLRSNSRPRKTLTNNTSGDEGDDDPRKQSRERLKHQCETEDKHDTFFDTMDSTPDLSSRDCSNSKLDISEMNPTPLVKVTPSESEESSGNKVPVVRRRQPTRSECLYKSVFHEHQ